MDIRLIPVRSALITAAAASVFAATACGSTSTPAAAPSSTAGTPSVTSSPSSTSPAPSSTAAMMSSAVGDPMGTGPVGPHQQADVTFAQQMTVHHQGAIAMADLAATRAASPAVKQLAAEIKAAQDPEIKLMAGWLAAWAPGSDMNGMPVTTATSSQMGGMAGGTGGFGSTASAMPGMMSDEQTSALTAATGPAFDKLFLQLMIVHHQGALTMATTEKTHGSNPAALALAQSIITSQTAQISQMQTMLR